MKCLLSEMKCINRQEIVHHKFIYTNVFTTIAYLLSNYRRMRGIYLEAFSTAAPLFAFIYIFFFSILYSFICPFYSLCFFLFFFYSSFPPFATCILVSLPLLSLITLAFLTW